MKLPLHLTVCYQTFRRNPRWAWFFDSFHRECGGDYSGIKMIVVDHFARERPILPDWIVHVPPKPTVWQGPHRLTQRNYFAASNARNTGLCLAPDGWIAWVDDLSVLIPGWLNAVKKAMEGEYLVCGAYSKVLDLVVEKGKVKSYVQSPNGRDSRWFLVGDDREPVSIGGGQLFGCSLAGPVEWFLEVNGWDERCDGMGGEDTMMGLMLKHCGHELKYDRSMMTLEDDLLHSEDNVDGKAPFLREIRKTEGREDASWAILNIVRSGEKFAPNWFDPPGIRGLRDKVLRGEPFPIMRIPEHHWYDGTPLKEM